MDKDAMIAIMAAALWGRSGYSEYASNAEISQIAIELAEEIWQAVMFPKKRTHPHPACYCYKE
jgi:hypothetical protein